MTKDEQEKSLEEILEKEPDFTSEEIEKRNARTMKMFKLLMGFALALIAVLITLGILFGS